MNAVFLVLTTSRFDRDLKKLNRQHSEIPDVLRTVVEVLTADPYNRGRQHAIKSWKLWPPGKASTVFVSDASDSATTSNVRPSF
jgi:hypothetical protein